MLTIKKIPQEVYAVALDYMNLDRAEDGGHSATYYEIAYHRRWMAFELEQAISDYLLSAGSFGAGGEFEDVCGHNLSPLAELMDDEQSVLNN